MALGCHLMNRRTFHALICLLAGLAGSPATADYVVCDDFEWPDTTLDRSTWWRGGLAGVDGTNAILNESDLTTARMFREGDFRFVIGGPSATSQGLFGLGDIDDGDPFIVLSSSGAGWRFHVRNGNQVHTGPVIAAALNRGDVVAFHWDAAGSSVSLNGAVKDTQTDVHPPAMPLTLLEWNNSGTNGQIIMDSVSYAAPPASGPGLPATAAAPAGARVLSARLVEDAFVDSARPDANCNGSTQAVCIRNGRFHPDLTGAGKVLDVGHLALLQFVLPPLPAGWRVHRARLAGVVVRSHNVYGMPGWAPDRPVELEVLGLAENPDLGAVTYRTLQDAAGRGVIADYTAWGSVNFTFGRQARSLEVLSFSTAAAPAGHLLQFPDAQGRLGEFVRSRIDSAEPRTITLAIGPGRTQAVSGMDCDVQFYARENTAGRAPMSLTLELEEAR